MINTDPCELSSIDGLTDSADTEQLVEAITSVATEVADLRETVECQEQTIEEQQATIDDLRDTVDDQQEIIDDLEEERAETRRQIATTRQDLTEVRKTVSEQADPTPDTDRQESLTPLERLIDGDRDDVAQHVTPSINRAATLLENLTDWGTQTPKGVTLKPADNPKTLLEAACDESLAWQQYYRAAEALELLTKGAVAFFDHDHHGKLVVLHEDSAVYNRLTNATTDHSQSSLAAD
jgi:hypothetical protein